MGVILYFMAYGRLPLQHIKQQYQLMFAIIDPEQKNIHYPPLESRNLKEVIRVFNTMI
jgi:hypothetical protein